MIAKRWAILLAAGLMSSADADVLLLPKDAVKSGKVKLTKDMLDYWQNGGSFSWTFTLDKPMNGESLSIEYSAIAPRAVQFSIDGAAAETVTLAKTGTWNNWKSVAIKNLSLPAGEHTITFSYEGKGKEYAVNVRNVKVGGSVAQVSETKKAAPSVKSDDLSLSFKNAALSGAIKKSAKSLNYWGKTGKASWDFNLDAPVKTGLLVKYAAPVARQLRLEIPGVLDEVVDFPATGGWLKFETKQIKEISLPAGKHSISLTYDGKSFCIDLVEVKLGKATAEKATKAVTKKAPQKPEVAAVVFDDQYPEVYSKKANWADTMVALRAAYSSPEMRALSNGKLFLNAKDGNAIWSDFAKECDWFLQDNQVHGEWGKGLFDARGDFRNYLDQSRNSDLEKKLIQHVLAELGENAGPLKAEANALIAKNPSPDNAAWLNLYEKMCAKRRQIRLAPLLKETKQIVYTTHTSMGGIYLATSTSGHKPGSEMRIIDLSPIEKGLPLKDEVLFNTNDGVVRDPEVSFDGTKLLYAARKSYKGTGTVGRLAPATGNYKIYEMDLATRESRQLTFDDTYGADFEPCYLPNGDIMFSSDRGVHEVTCGWGDSANLFLMNKDGKYARRVGFDQTQTAFPHLLDDGRVVYTRRDYNDRGQSYAHALFVMNPDGSHQTEYYGNNSMAPTSIQHTRSIPGTHKAMGIAGGYHTTQGGKIVTIDTTKGTQNYDGLSFYNWTPTPLDKINNENFCRVGEQFTHPYPFNEKSLLVSMAPIGGYLTSSHGGLDNKKEKEFMRYKLYYMTLDGRREMLASHPTLSCMQGVPVRPRETPMARASALDYSSDKSTCYVQDVYYGPSAEGIKRGTIKKLRVIELFYKPITIGAGGWGPSRKEVGPGRKYSGYGWHSVLPVGVGSVSFDAKEILGEVDVHEDGSAMFEIPARTPVYFQLIDENGLAVQTMRSWATLMPRENFSCVGCHEENDSAPLPNTRTTAMTQAPQKLQPVKYLTGQPFSYAKTIQPIFNQHCVSCHAPGKKAAKIDLSDTIVEDGKDHKGTEMTRLKFYQSYLTLLDVKWDNGKRGKRLDQGRPNKWVDYYTRMATTELTPPYYAGSTKSGIIKMLQNGHGKTQITKEEIGAISAWIDLNVPFIGEYDEMNIWDDSAKERYAEKLGMRHKMEAIEAENIKAFIEAGQP